MAITHSMSTRILVNELAASAKLRSVTAQASRALGDVTAFTDEGNKWIPGLHSGTFSLEGMFQDDGLLTELKNRMTGAGSDLQVSAGFAGFDAGSPVAMAVGSVQTYSIASSVTEPVSFTVESPSDERVDLGHSLHSHTAETTTGNGSAVDNTDPTTNGGAGVLHVTGVSGTTPTLNVKIQHSTDNSVWVDLITFTQATAATSERLTVTGTVNRYVRAIHTIAGTSPSFTYVVAFARR